MIRALVLFVAMIMAMGADCDPDPGPTPCYQGPPSDPCLPGYCYIGGTCQPQQP